jgi:hypothetical protein
MRAQKKGWTCGPAGSLSSALAGGFVAGLAAAATLFVTRLVVDFGAVALLVRILGTWHASAERIFHRELWASLKVAAYPFVGDRVYRPGFDAPVVWIALVVVMVSSIGVGVMFALIARGRSRMVTCAIAIPFGFAVWIFDMLLLEPSPATVVEAIPSGLALAFTFLWYERRLTAGPLSRR